MSYPMPLKCQSCEHTLISLENVHQGWLKYEVECVVRCDLDPLHHRVGCVCADIYCDRKVVNNGEET